MKKIYNIMIETSIEFNFFISIVIYVIDIRKGLLLLLNQYKHLYFKKVATFIFISLSCLTNITWFILNNQLPMSSILIQQVNKFLMEQTNYIKVITLSINNWISNISLMTSNKLQLLQVILYKVEITKLRMTFAILIIMLTD